VTEAASVIVKIRIGNVKSQILYDPATYGEYFQSCMDAIDNHTTVVVKDHEMTPAFQKGYWDGMIHLFNSCTMNKNNLGAFEFYTGKLRTVLEILRRFGYTVEFIDNRYRPETGRIEYEWNEKFPPYDFQEEIINTAVAKNRGIIKLATGGGKTNVAAGVIQKLGVAPFIFFVTTKDLMDQAYKRFKSLLKTDKIGRIGDGHCEIYDVNVCTIQTCVMAFGKEEEYLAQQKKMSSLLEGGKTSKEKLVSAERYQDIRDLVINAEGIIFDEIHHAASDTCRMILEFCDKALFRYGLGATVERDDGLDKVIEALFGDYICNISLSYLIKRGFLIPPTIFMVPQKDDLGMCENYQTEYKTYVTENHTRNQKIAQCAAAAIGGGLQTLVLVRYIPHGEKLEKMINNIAGEGSAILLHGTLSSAKRKELIGKMQSKELKCIIATSLADEGLDIQCLQCLVLAGSGKSFVKTIQRIGRVIRLDPDNPNKVAIVYDFMDLASKILKKHSLRRMAIYLEEEMFKVIDMRKQAIKSRKVF